MGNNLFTPKIFQVIAPGIKNEYISDLFYKNCKESSISKPLKIKSSQIIYGDEYKDKISIEKINF
jgi:hypothetical protein